MPLYLSCAFFFYVLCSLPAYLSTCLPVYVSTFQLVYLSTCLRLDVSTFQRVHVSTCSTFQRANVPTYLPPRSALPTFPLACRYHYPISSHPSTAFPGRIWSCFFVGSTRQEPVIAFTGRLAPPASDISLSYFTHRGYGIFTMKKILIFDQVTADKSASSAYQSFFHFTSSIF